MVASDEHRRLPGGQEQFADGFGGNGTSMRMAAGGRVPCAVERDEDGWWYTRSQARQGARLAVPALGLVSSSGNQPKPGDYAPDLLLSRLNWLLLV